MSAKTETSLGELKINKLSMEQYSEALSKGEIVENEFYAFPESDFDVTELSQKVSGLESDLTNVQNDLTNVQNDVTEVNSNLSRLGIADRLIDATLTTSETQVDLTSGTKLSDYAFVLIIIENSGTNRTTMLLPMQNFVYSTNNTFLDIYADSNYVATCKYVSDTVVSVKIDKSQTGATLEMYGIFKIV